MKHTGVCQVTFGSSGVSNPLGFLLVQPDCDRRAIIMARVLTVVREACVSLHSKWINDLSEHYLSKGLV